MRAVTRREFSAAGAAAIGALALGGCADGGFGHDDGASEQQREPSAVSICLDGVPRAYHAGIYVAQAKGYFEDGLLEVEVVLPDAEHGALARVQEGSCEFGVVGQDLLAGAFGCDEPLSVLAVAALVQANTAGFCVRGKKASRARDLEGAVLASRGSAAGNAVMELAVLEDGGDFSDVLLGRAAPVDRSPYQVLSEDEGIDAVWGEACWDALALERAEGAFSFVPFADYLADLGAYPATNFYGPLLMANDTYLVRRPEEARAFVDAVRRGCLYAQRHPGRAAELLCEQVPQLDAALARESLEQLAPLFTGGADEWGGIDQKRWDAFFSLMWGKGLVRNEIPAHHGYSMDYLYDEK